MTTSIPIQFDPDGYDGGDEVWTTYKGRQVRVEDMTDDHLRNTIFFLQRRLGFRIGRYVGKYGPSNKNLKELLHHTPEPVDVYNALRMEANRRGLPWI